MPCWLVTLKKCRHTGRSVYTARLRVCRVALHVGACSKVLSRRARPPPAARARAEPSCGRHRALGPGPMTGRDVTSAPERIIKCRATRLSPSFGSAVRYSRRSACSYRQPTVPGREAGCPRPFALAACLRCGDADGTAVLLPSTATLRLRTLQPRSPLNRLSATPSIRRDRLSSLSLDTTFYNTVVYTSSLRLPRVARTRGRPKLRGGWERGGRRTSDSMKREAGHRPSRRGRSL